MSKPVFCASLWSLAGHPSPEKEWSLGARLKAVKKAGFDAVSGPPEARLSALARDQGLRRLAAFIAPDVETLVKGLDLCARDAAERVNIQLGTPEMSPAETFDFCRSALDLADKRGLRVSFETHRGTALETPDKLRSLAAAVMKASGQMLPITLDFSHYAVVRQIPVPDWPAWLAEHRALVAASDLFHLRPHTPHHVQVPFTSRGKPSAEARAWLPFARETLRVWKQFPSNADRELFLCPELGPYGGYALSCAPKSWPETVLLAEALREAWED